MKDKNNSFIEELTKDLKPVKRLQHPFLRFITWFALTFIVSILVLFAFHYIKPSKISNFENPLYRWELILGILSVFATGLCAYFLSIPGFPFQRILKFVAIFPSIAFVSLMSYEFKYLTKDSLTPKEGICSGTILLLSGIAFALMIWRLRRSFSTELKWSAFYIALSCAMLPTTLIQVTCIINPLHTLLGHLLPFLLVIALIFFIAPTIMKKFNRS